MIFLSARVIHSATVRTGGGITRCARWASPRHQYSSAAEQINKSNLVPWILVATSLTAGGTYIALQPRDASHHVDGHAHGTHEKKEDEKEDDSVREEMRQKEARKRDLEAAQACAPKPERAGNSVQNHSKAAETNENKVRKGKFTDREFDNHITAHSGDPGKDFEKIDEKKKKAESQG